MAIVVLKKRVAAIVVRVKTLSVFCTFHAAHFVELDNRTVAAPGPDTGSVILGTPATTTYYILFDKTAIATPRLYAVTANIFQKIAAYDYIQAGEPIPRTVRKRRPPANTVAVGADKMTVFNQKAVETRGGTAFALEEYSTAFY